MLIYFVFNGQIRWILHFIFIMEWKDSFLDVNNTPEIKFEFEFVFGVVGSLEVVLSSSVNNESHELDFKIKENHI